MKLGREKVHSCFSILTRRAIKSTLKHSVEIVDVFEAYGMCNIAYRKRTMAEQIGGAFDAHIVYKGCDSFIIVSFESTVNVLIGLAG